MQRRRVMRPGRAGRVRRLRRVVLTIAAVAAVIVPLPVLAADAPPHQSDCPGAGCQAKAVTDPLWTVPLSGTGTWSAGASADGNGDQGTVPAVGQAYLAVGGGLAVLGTGLTVTGYRLSDGKQRWQVLLSAAVGASIISVRAWSGVVTVGLMAPSGDSRTEVLVDAATGKALRRYPAAVFGGAVAASASTTVVVGSTTVTGYNNATGAIRWRQAVASGESWRVDGQTQTLYLAKPSVAAGSSSVAALKVINLNSGSERMLSPPLDRPFSGTLAMAEDGAVLFSSAYGVSAYSGSTGALLWKVPYVVAEGTDPAAGLVYLAADDSSLIGVDPQTGTVRARVPASLAQGTSSVYAVRNGVAFGLDSGANGAAWGYRLAAARVTLNSTGLPWPHFFSDLSGLGGSAAGSGDTASARTGSARTGSAATGSAATGSASTGSASTVSGDTVVITVCPHLASAAPICADPELVAFNL